MGHVDLHNPFSRTFKWNFLLPLDQRVQFFTFSLKLKLLCLLSESLPRSEAQATVVPELEMPSLPAISVLQWPLLSKKSS